MDLVSDIYMRNGYIKPTKRRKNQVETNILDNDGNEDTDDELL